MEENQNKNEYRNPYASSDDSNDYGLPEVDFQPVQREEFQQPAPVYKTVNKSAVKKEEKEKEKSSVVPILISIFVFLLLAAGGAYYYYFEYMVEEPVAEYEPYVEPVEVIEEPEVYVAEEVYVEPAQPVEGSITYINERTNRNYIVVGSFFDEDNASDFVNKLSSQGVSTKIIQPNKFRRFHKVAVADYESFGEATDNIDNFKPTYGDQIWVLTY